MKNYFYKCFDCKAEYSANQIEEEFIYLCPACGSAEKNKPLKGVLTVEYDFSYLSNQLSSEKFLKYPAGQFWLYPELWPLNFSGFQESYLTRLALANKQLYKYKIGNSEIYIQDETRNPTLSFKDRASSLVALKAIEMGITEIAAASTGNAGSSLAGICARLGLTSIIYVPKNIPDAKKIQIEAFGAKIVVINGDYDMAFDTCLEDSIKNKWYNRNTAYNPLTIEGKKSAAYDIFISTKGKIPDNIFVPCGDGVIISGIHKGFSEMLKLGFINKLPKLIAVQSEKGDAVVRYLKNGIFDYIPASTIADSISAGAPRNLYMTAEAIKKSGGFAISVSDDEILSAMKEFIRETGILCEPSSASSYAAYKNALNQGKITASEKSLLLITGNGLKDVEALKKII